MSRRTQILDAALACFTEHGYEQTTIDAIRARSGASVGSIYHHFGGKEDIAGALYAAALRDYQSGLLATLSGSAERTIPAMVRHHLRWVDANPQLASFMFSLRMTTDEIRELNRHAFDAVAAWRAEHARELQPLSFDAFYAVVIGPAQEAARHRLAGRTQTPLRRLERELGDAAWRAIKGDDA